jgi:hypothetical protein
MPPVNGVGEPGAGEPHARFEVAGAGKGMTWPRSPGVAQPTGKPAEERPWALPSDIITSPAPDPTPGGGSGSSGVLARNASLRAVRVPPPPTGSANSRPLLVPGTQEADVRRLLQAIGELTGGNPVEKRGCFVLRRNGDLDTAGAQGVQPGTFGNASSALVSTVRATPAERKHRHFGCGGPLRPSKVAEVRYRPYTVGRR